MAVRSGRRGEPSNYWWEIADIALITAAGVGSLGRLWEQDIWWQTRLGEGLLTFNGGFPSEESWTYTSHGKPFHNHWWLMSAVFAATHGIGGVPALVLLRGVLSSAVAWCLLRIHRPGPTRWVAASSAFALSKQRLQLRPETACCLLFVALFSIRARVERVDNLCRHAAPLAAAWTGPVLQMWGVVLLAANTHYGVAPWVALAAVVLLADDALPVHVVPKQGDLVRLTSGILRAAPAVLALFATPQPLAGIRYILFHTKANYRDTKKLDNPEHRPLLEDWNDAFSTGAAEQEGVGLLLGAYLASSLLVPMVWLLRPRPSRPPGLRHPAAVLPALLLLQHLAFERSRCLIYPVFFMAAMLGAPGEESGGAARVPPPDVPDRDGPSQARASVLQENHCAEPGGDCLRNRRGSSVQAGIRPDARELAQRTRSRSSSEDVHRECEHEPPQAARRMLASMGERERDLTVAEWLHAAPRTLRRAVEVAAFLCSLAVLAWRRDRHIGHLNMSLKHWPVRSVEFVRHAAPAGNVYHTMTYGGYMVYWLQEYKLWGDTREYPFKHLEDVYARAYLNPEVLNSEILDAHGVNTVLTKIAPTQQLADGNWEDVAVRFLGAGHRWIRVFFDHTSEVFLRVVDQHLPLIEQYAYMNLNPAMPPDMHARTLLGSGSQDRTVVKRLGIELQRCLNEKYVELYCRLVDLMVRSPKMRAEAAARERDSLKAFMSSPVFWDERELVQAYARSTVLLLEAKIGST